MWKTWVILLVLLAAFVGVRWQMEKNDNIKKFTPVETSKSSNDLPKKKPAGLKKATMIPGQLVSLKTNKGVIDFVLYEKDCPKTTARVAKLVEAGCYDGVNFPRVEDWVIQTGECKKQSPKPMGCEILRGLTHVKGSVGMARAESRNSNTSVFYITLDPKPDLDPDYTNFGQVIRGMDVVEKIRRGDMIEKATIRPLTKEDKERFYEMLQIQAERETE